MFFRILLFFIIFFSALVQGANRKFTVAFAPDYAPFTYIENGKLEGLLIDYWDFWAKKNNYEVKFVNAKVWDDAVEMVKKGKVDFFLSSPLSYEDWAKSSKTLYKIEASTFTHKDTTNTFDKNGSYIIAVVGNTYKETIKTNFPNSKLLVYKDYSSIFKDFVSKKIDLIYDDKIAIELFALRNNYFHLIRPIKLLNKILDVKAISKDEELINIFNKGLKKLSKEELSLIENKWLIGKSIISVKPKTLSFTKKEKEFIKNHIVRMSESKDWRPLSFEDDGKLSGISKDFWELVVKRTGLKSKLTFFENFTSQLNTIKYGKQDIISSTGITKDRKEYALFSKPYYSFPLSIVTLKDENFIENIEEILDKKIAVGKNYTAHEIIKEHYPKIDFLLVDDVKEGLKAVSNKEAYAFVDIKSTLDYSIKWFGFDDLKITGNTGFNLDLAIMINKNYPILKSIFDKIISNLDEKELQSIITRWENIQFENRPNYKNIVWILSIFIFIILMILYKEFKTSQENKKLEKIVNERTKDLKELTVLLEQKVREKTKELQETNYILNEGEKISNMGSFQFNAKENKMIFSKHLLNMLKINEDEKNISFELVLDYVHKGDKDKVAKGLKNSKRVSFRLIIEDKIQYTLLDSKVTKFDENGKALIYTGIIFDITNIRKLREETRKKDMILAQQSKMAAMGEMLENIAHQWRQPLSVISTASTGLQLQLDFSETVPKDAIFEAVDTINQQAQYLSKTIDDFKNFFNPNKIKVDFDINNSIEKTLLLIKQKIKKKNVTVIKESENIRLFSYESELIQVLLNIFNNALDAFKNNSNNYLLIKTEKKDKYIIIKITDSAGGIKKDIITRIFEPYFTTKHKSQGTGIGLYMSNEIVTKHLNGSIKVLNKSFVYKGTKYFGASFIIKLRLFFPPPLNGHERLKEYELLNKGFM